MGSSKPCPGCGTIDKSRKSTEVCWECADKLKKYNNLCAVLDKHNADKIPVVFAKRSYQNKHIFIRGNQRENFGRQLQDAFQAIALAATTKAIDYPGRENLYQVLEQGDYAIYGGGAQYGYMNKELAVAIRTLHDLIQPSLDAAYASGKIDGHNLLGRLATGDIAPNEFFAQTQPNPARS